MVQKEFSEVVQVVETTNMGARGIFADAILAIIAYDREGHPYILVVHRDGGVTLLPDTEAVREALAAAGVLLVSLARLRARGTKTAGFWHCVRKRRSPSSRSMRMAKSSSW